MKSRIKQMIPKVLNMLKDNHYQTAEHLAKETGLSTYSIYRMVRIMRYDGVGIISTQKGYVLSKYAFKNDDVHFLRVLHGRRTSDFVALTAAAPDIRKRWSSFKQGEQLKQIISPLKLNVATLKRGIKVLLSCEKNSEKMIS